MGIKKFKVGDLVYYRASRDNKYANGENQLGVVVKVIVEANPLFAGHPDTEMFTSEYVVKWFKSGYTSTLLGFNLIKLQI